MPNNKPPIRLRRPKPRPLAFCLALVGVEIPLVVLKVAMSHDPGNPAFALAVMVCLVGFGSAWERLALGDGDGAKSGVLAGTAATAGLVVGLKWGVTALLAFFVGLAVIGAPIQWLADRRRAREDEAERAAPPVFPDRKREKRAVFRRLAPRVLAAVAVRTERGCVAAERAALPDILARELGPGAPGPTGVDRFVAQAENRRDDLDELLWLFHRNCSYESHLALVGMALRLFHSARPPDRAGLFLARDMARNIGVSEADLRVLEAEAPVVAADEAQTEKRRHLEEEAGERLEAEQARAAVESRFGRETLWLTGLQVGCLLLAGVCAVGGQRTENVGALFFGLFLLLTLILGLFHFVFGPMRHARLDRHLARERRQAREERRRKEAAHALAARLLTAFARLDGRFTREAWAATLAFFQDEPGDDAARLDRIKTLVKRALDDPQDLDRILRAFARDAPDSSRRALADLALRLASAQGPPSPAKARLARDVAAALDIRSDRPAS